MIEINPHAACERRQSHSWQRACEEIEKRQKTERHLNFWRPFAVVLIFCEVARLVVDWGWVR